MLYVTNSFIFNIPIHDNVIDVCYNIEKYITEYINKYVINTQKKEMILLKLLSYEYTNPKLCFNCISILDKFSILINATFRCMLFANNMLIKNVTFNKKIDAVKVFTKTINTITLTCINVDNSMDTSSQNTHNVIIKQVNYINNNVNMIVEPYDETTSKSFIFNTNFDKSNKLFAILEENINEKFTFTFNNSKTISYKGIIRYIMSLPHNVNYELVILKKDITITQYNHNLIPSILNDQYINAVLIGLYNVFIYFSNSLDI